MEVDSQKVQEEHIVLEFVLKDVDAMMAKMVAEPQIHQREPGMETLVASIVNSSSPAIRLLWG